MTISILYVGGPSIRKKTPTNTKYAGVFFISYLTYQLTTNL
jgi:hypothetical protein